MYSTVLRIECSPRRTSLEVIVLHRNGFLVQQLLLWKLSCVHTVVTFQADLVHYRIPYDANPL